MNWVRFRGPSLLTAEGKASRSWAKGSLPDLLWLVTMLGQDFVLHTLELPRPSRRGHRPAGTRQAAAARLCFAVGRAAWQLGSVGQVAKGRVCPLGIGSHSGYPLGFPHSPRSALGGRLGAGDTLSTCTAPCCSQAPGRCLSQGPDQGCHGESTSPENLSPEAMGGFRDPVPEEWAEGWELPAAAR